MFCCSYCLYGVWLWLMWLMVFELSRLLCLRLMVIILFGLSLFLCIMCLVGIFYMFVLDVIRKWWLEVSI